MHKYRLISKKGEGTFSEVLKAQSIKTGRYVAIKCMKNTFDTIEQVNNLREIQALRRLGGHPNVIKLMEVLYDEPTGRLALVFELMNMNMYEAIRGRRHYLQDMKIRHYVYELLKALDHMHRHGIFHRDVKPENLLLCSDERQDIEQIKLADLGSCRGIYSRQPYTEYISTRWYRAPECLLTDGYYNFKMDIFAAGCVWFEIVGLFPLFPGSNELDQIQKIHTVLGTPSPELLARKFKRNASHMDFNFPEKRGSGIERLIPHASVEATTLMNKMLEYDPDDRIIARQALKDSFFRELRDADRAQQKEKEQREREASTTFSKEPRDVKDRESGATAGEKTPTGTVETTPRRRESEAPAGPGLVNCSSSSSIGSAVRDAAPSDERPEVTGGEASNDDASVHESVQERTEVRIGGNYGGSTLPVLAKDMSKVKEAPSGPDNHADDEDTQEDSMLLPPIGRQNQPAGMLHATGKQKEKPKAFKAAANATLRGAAPFGASTIDSNGLTGHGLTSSKGFDPSATSSSLAMNSTYGKKFGQASTYGQSSHAGPSHSSSLAPQGDRREQKSQLPRQYVSPYIQKQNKR
mmetsp:Transcript_64864/g.154877  ORF Transcript_64864/g.154877 Transcript_64864/m.154877 type:complete len:580 (+) Transcript_64864:62-1801(+)